MSKVALSEGQRLPGVRSQVLPVGLVTSRSGAADPAWRPTAHAWYGQRARDALDGLPKW